MNSKYNLIETYNLCIKNDKLDSPRKVYLSLEIKTFKNLNNNQSNRKYHNCDRFSMKNQLNYALK